MQKFFIVFISLFLVSSLRSEDKVIFSQDFESATVGTDLIGNLQVKNFNAGGGAAWTYDLATGVQAIAGNASAHINIQNPGDQWWGLQLKFEDASFTNVVKGLKYRISFKIKSSTANNYCQFYVQGQSSFVQEVNIPDANVVQDVTIETTAMDNSGTANFMWAFGQYSNTGDIWIDDVVVTELNSTSYVPLNYSEDFDNAVVAASTIADFDVANYGNGLWNFSLEQNGTDPANKCVRLDIMQNSDDWWTLQFKNSKLNVEKGKQYIIDFKAKSDIDNSLLFRIEQTVLFEQRVNVKGDGTFQSFSIESTAMDNSGPANFMWAFGRPTALGTIWLDNISIREKKTSTDVGQHGETQAVNFIFEDDDIRVLSDIQSSVSVYNTLGCLLARKMVSGSGQLIHVNSRDKVLMVVYKDTLGKTVVKKLLRK